MLRIAADLVGLHATDPQTPYLSLLARIRDFTAERLDRELYETHAIGRVPAMRNTLFLEPRSLLRTVFAATGPTGVRSSWRFFAGRLTMNEYKAAAPRIVEALRGRGLTVRELRAELHLDCDVSAVVKLLCDGAVLIRARPPAGPRSGQYAYALTTEWLPGLDLADPGDEAQALTDLIRAYVRSYGPVSEADIAWWTGAPTRAVRAALNRLGDELANVAVEAADTEQLMVRADLDALLTAEDINSGGLALLPALDPYTQGYRARGRYLDAAHAPFVVDRKGNVTSTIVLDGRVVGVWDLAQHPAPELRVHLLEPIDDAQRLRLRSLGEHTAAFLLGEPPAIIEYRAMIPLTQRAGWVRSPLEGASHPRSLESRNAHP